MDLDLKANGIRLRTFSVEHINTKFVSWLNDPIVVQYSNQRFILHTHDTCYKYFKSFSGTDNLYLAIEDASSYNFYGTITAYRSVHHGTADMGIMLGDRSVWGKGIGLLAWNLLMTFLFADCRVRKVTGGTLRSNVAMVRIMEKSGMRLEATRFAQELVNGVPTDILYFCMFSDVF